MACVAGSSSEAFFCVASMMNVSERITSSSARIDFLRLTKSATIMCGNTTMSRSGSTGKARVSPGAGGGRGFAVVMDPSPHCRHRVTPARVRHSVAHIEEFATVREVRQEHIYERMQ